MKVVGVLLLLGATATAGPTRIAVMTGREDIAALQVALAGTGTQLVQAESPHAGLRLDRAAIAQHTALDARADAGVWIETEPGDAQVFVVSADGTLRHAPLPLADGTPRVFAAIATSLLDELIAPPLDVSVDVHVDVTAQPIRLDAAFDAPGTTQPTLAMSGEQVAHASQTLVEVGTMFSPISAGIEGSILIPVSPTWRLGVAGGVSRYLTQDRALFELLAEVRHVGAGRKHWDVAAIGGVGGPADFFPSGVVGMRIQRTYELADSSIGISLSPVAIIWDGVFPGIFLSVRWGLPI